MAFYFIILFDKNQIILMAGSINKNKNWSSAPTKNRYPQGHFEGQKDVPLNRSKNLITPARVPVTIGLH